MGILMSPPSWSSLPPPTQREFLKGDSSWHGGLTQARNWAVGWHSRCSYALGLSLSLPAVGISLAGWQFPARVLGRCPSLWGQHNENLPFWGRAAWKCWQWCWRMTSPRNRLQPGKDQSQKTKVQFSPLSVECSKAYYSCLLWIAQGAGALVAAAPYHSLNWRPSLLTRVFLPS